VNSIRARLTFSYAVIVALVLVVVALLGTRLLFEVLARPSYDALSASDVRARASIAAHANVPVERLVPLVEAAAAGPGIAVLGRHHHRLGGRSPLGAPPDPPAPERGSGGRVLHGTLAWMLGLGPRRIDVRGAGVTIVPDLRLVEPAIAQSLGALGIAIVLAIVAAWSFARWLAAQALAPMIAVTEQLERFAAGDFGTRTIVTSDTAELGRLIGAYNGAVGQVSEAMNERTEIERRLRRFLADAGHELRTPITVMGGYVQILRKGGFDDAAIREIALDTLELEVGRSRRLVERLLTLARLERPERSDVSSVDLEVLVRDAIASVTRARGGEIDLACDATAVVLADPAELHEAVGNLVDNAVKYGGGTPIRVSIDAEADDVSVRVRDGGPGIPKAERERIFERFFRGSEHGEIDGSGLGLAIGERAAARFGGTIVLEDGTAGSTTFRLTLPSASATRADRATIRL
jgi:signal transduction histidine kinase